MISDILSDARAHIHDYLRDFPHVYVESLPEITYVLEAMRQLQERLDTPYTPDEHAVSMVVKAPAKEESA